eukprot:579221-Pyramimonas_sp.AAC.1
MNRRLGSSPRKIPGPTKVFFQCRREPLVAPSVEENQASDLSPPPPLRSASSDVGTSHSA